jgi:Uma2 family endonuclease
VTSEVSVAGGSSEGIDSTEPSPAEPDPMKRATYEDVLNAPEHKVAEVLDGELFLSPRPGQAHASVASQVGMILGNPFHRGVDGPGGWRILDEPELHFGEHVVVPDLAGWRRERMPAISRQAFFTLVPDWVCEVLSPATERIDRGRKLRIYAEAGVAHAWFLKPADRTLEVLRLRDGAWTIVAIWADAAVVRAEPFEAIELELGQLWEDEAPATASP